jgi:HEAT repeat protein
VDRLIHVFDMNRDNEIRIEIINACETIGTVTVNDFLVEKLSSREPDIRYASIKALASCGNKHAVEHLYDIARKTTGNRKIKREAAHAIEAIQSRLGDVEKGWLTLSETDSQEGALSVIGETEEGKLSLSGDEEE